MKLSSKIALTGVILHLAILTSAILIGFIKPSSWLPLALLYTFYYPIVWIFNTFGYAPGGFIAILYFAIGGAILYGAIFWVIGVLINKIKK